MKIKLIMLTVLMVLNLSVHGVAYAKASSSSKKSHIKGKVCTEETTGSLTLRSQPGRGYKSLAMIPNGTPLTILDTVKAKDGSWHHVQYGKKFGWVFDYYVCLD